MLPCAHGNAGQLWVFDRCRCSNEVGDFSADCKEDLDLKRLCIIQWSSSFVKQFRFLQYVVFAARSVQYFVLGKQMWKLQIISTGDVHISKIDELKEV